MDLSEHLDPVAATRAIDSAYWRYLLTTMSTNEPRINEAIRKGFEAIHRPMVVGPIIESSPQYRSGASVAELVEQHVLSPEWLERDFGGQVIPERPLYLHQEQAVVRAVVERRNLVVATGTGSGKTESFLIPIIEEAFRQREKGVLRPGVRALLLYPMNALANDQLKRLRMLLARSPEITFGRYTGETPQTRAEGIAALHASLPDAQVLPNELLGREEMQDGPPHILLTNYAMLEYLLLRPADSPLFEPSGDHGWRFIVLDEVHSYDGAMGLEIGMLLRRLRDRVGRAAGEVQAIATSATVGGINDRPIVARFAQDLFDLPFEWDDLDPARQDVIVATREAPIMPPAGHHPVDLPTAIAESDDASAQALLSDGRVQTLLQSLWQGPMTLQQVAEGISNPPDPMLAGDLVRRLSSLEDPASGVPFLRARFHTFVRAPDGVDVCLRIHADGGLRAFLEPQRHCPECGEGAPVTELTTCRRCNQWHLRGVLSADGQLQRAADREDIDTAVRYVAPRASDVVNEDDGDDEGSANPFGPGRREEERLRLCVGCMRLSDRDSCTCAAAQVVPVVLASRTSGGSIRCVNCNAPASQRGPRRLWLGSDAPPAVVASALFDALPRVPHRPRFLSFADSRQDAAFFAPYLERTYGRVARRRLLLEALRKGWAMVDGDGLRINDLAPMIRRAAAAQRFFAPTAGALEQTAVAQAWILAELSAMDSRQSLAGVGLAARRLARPEKWNAPTNLLEPPWSLTTDEAWLLIETLLKTLLDDQAIAFPDGVNPAGEAFSPRNKEVGFRLSDHANHRDLMLQGWIPARGLNARLDYLDRLLGRLQPGWSPETRRAAALDALNGLWRVVSAGTGPLLGYAIATSHPQLGAYYQLDSGYWELAAPSSLAKCDVCAAIEYNAIRGVCPSYRCEGTVVQLKEALAQDHYRSLYDSPSAGRLVAEEHTAQWSPVEAARVQGRFVSADGDINVLSCSTTFELGVDVGELEAVLLRNVPPSAANYVQRAGRAGRRSSSVGFIVTFAQLRPHDTQAFDRALELVAGRVPAPRIPARNSRIIRRHVHSVALSRFLRRLVISGQPWPRTAGAFFEPDPATSPCSQFRDYLAVQDALLRDELSRIVPAELHQELGIDTWSWAEELADDDPLTSALARAESETLSDIELYTQLVDDAADHHDGHALNRFKAVLNTIRSADLLGMLAGRNVLPKYGFPVDVVPLRTAHVAIREAKAVSLDRDLRIAISEYAPGAGVVAAKRLWVSGGLHLLPNRALPQRAYAVCRECNRLYLGAADLASCPQCQEPIRGGTMVQPLFGFVSRDPDVKPLGEERPQRLYATRVLFHELGDPSPRDVLLVGDSGPTVMGRFSRQGSLAVVNDARGRHFRICHRCGYAAIGGAAGGGHHHPSSGRTCTGALVSADIGHTFTSDIAEFHFPRLTRANSAFRASLLAALLEGARRTLQVGHGDLDGVTYLEHQVPIFALFDDVPGGAGLAREAYSRIRDVLEDANRVCSCTCGEHSSCYGCLRSYRNQHEHEQLDRTAAGEALSALLNATR